MDLTSSLLVGTAELASVLKRPAPLIRAAFAAGLIPLKSDRRAGCHTFARADAELLSAILAAGFATGTPLDDRLRAFYVMRLIEMKTFGKPSVQVEPDFDSADYLRAAITAESADGSLAGVRRSALTTAFSAVDGGVL